MWERFSFAHNSVDVLYLQDELSNRQPVVDGDSEDKVSEDALKKLGLLQTHIFDFSDFLYFEHCVKTEINLD